VDRFDEPLDAQSGAEVERLRLAAGDSVEKPCGLDRLQVVEAELMTRRYAEQSMGRMVWGGLNPAKPLTPERIVG
jgi:hypothetical protein